MILAAFLAATIPVTLLAVEIFRAVWMEGRIHTATDAAALAAAMQTRLVEEVDARGTIYSRYLEVKPAQAQAAAEDMLAANLAVMGMAAPDYQASAAVQTSQDTASVTIQVQAAGPVAGWLTNLSKTATARAVLKNP